MDANLAEFTREGLLKFSPGIESHLVLHGLVARFILPSERLPKVMRWNEGNIGDLSCGTVTDGMRQRGHTVAKQHGLTCFDLNPEAVPLGSGVHLRCLFIDADQLDADGRIRYVALLTLHGEARCRKIQRYEGGSGILSDDLTSNDRSFMEHLGILTGPMPTDPLVEVLGRAGLTPEDVVKNTESFAFLVLTYLSLWGEEKGAAGSAMLHVPVKDPRLCGRRAGPAAKAVLGARHSG
jgi:hypothetical protein